MAATPRRSWEGKGSRHSRGYGSAWVKTRDRILARDKWLCQECLRNGMLTPLCVNRWDHAVDHITPKANGGTDEDSNLQSLCRECHWQKTEREAAEAQGRRKRVTIGEDGWPL